MEPPRAPLVFSIPAVTVPTQALAIQPQLAPLAPVAPMAVAPACKPQELSATDTLLLEMLLRQAASQQSASSSASSAKAAAASKTALDLETEARLTALENRLDRILEALEK
jgi:hypothetical protein